MYIHVGENVILKTANQIYNLNSTVAILLDGLYFKKNGATWRLYTNGLLDGGSGGAPV